MSEIITISEASRRSGVAASALRFYETQGLIKSERAGSGHRRYPRAVLRRVAFIVFAQRMGLTLEEVRPAIVSATTAAPKGMLNTAEVGFTIAANDQILDAELFNDVVLAYRNGGPIRVRDVGQADGAAN